MMEQRGVEISTENSLYSLTGKSIGVVERLTLRDCSLRCTSYSLTESGGEGEGRKEGRLLRSSAGSGVHMEAKWLLIVWAACSWVSWLTHGKEDEFCFGEPIKCLILLYH